jgi:hypothetical protein
MTITELKDLHDQLLPDDDQVGVPFHQSWSVCVHAALRGVCDGSGCNAPPIVSARIGHSGGCYCEACWRGDGLAWLLAEIDVSQDARVGR